MRHVICPNCGRLFPVLPVDSVGNCACGLDYQIAGEVIRWTPDARYPESGTSSYEQPLDDHPFARRVLEDGRTLTVYPEAFQTARLLIDPAGSKPGSAADSYFQFASVEAAVVALHAMTPDDVEPDGWIRAAPPRFRRRPNADAAKEFVAE